MKGWTSITNLSENNYIITVDVYNYQCEQFKTINEPVRVKVINYFNFKTVYCSNLNSGEEEIRVCFGSFGDCLTQICWNKNERICNKQKSV